MHLIDGASPQRHRKEPYLAVVFVYFQQCFEVWSLNVAPFPINNPYAYLN